MIHIDRSFLSNQHLIHNVSGLVQKPTRGWDFKTERPELKVELSIKTVETASGNSYPPISSTSDVRYICFQAVREGVKNRGTQLSVNFFLLNLRHQAIRLRNR